MQTYQIVIKAKMSGTGTIQDLASDFCDIKIDMKKHDYVVLIAAFYNHKPYKFNNLFDAAEKAHNLEKEGYNNVTVLDKNGNNVTKEAETEYYDMMGQID